MKKLLFWAVLLMTGFAFYSCDERFDNPVAERQDSSSPNATWSYEVGLKFQNFWLNHPDLNWNNWGTWDVDGEEVTYKAPSTVYVYNKAGDFLGELTATEEFDYDAFNWDKYYKFAGTLKGAIGDELVISTLKDFDYYSKQDGTLKSIAENCYLQVAEVPIIVANNAAKTIGTQNAELKSAILAIFGRFSGISDDSDRSITLTSDSLAYIPENEEGVKTFTINLAEAVKPQSEGLFWAFAPGAKEEATYTWELNSENGYKGINIWKGYYSPSNSLNYIWNLYFTPIELDLTKYTKYLKDIKEQEAPYYITIQTDNNDKIEPIIYQSSKDTVEVQMRIYGKATIKDLVIGKKGYLRLQGYKSKYGNPTVEYNYLPVITVIGENSITSTASYSFASYSEATLKGDGTLKVEAKNNGINISGSYYEETADDNWNWTYTYKPAKLIVTENVKLISNSRVSINSTWIDDKYVANELVLKGGSLEAKGQEYNYAIALWGGKLNISEGTSVKATTGMTGDGAICIYDSETSAEATIESLVADKTKFTDETKDGVRTITPKK